MDKANSVVEVFTGYMIFAFMALLFLQVLMRFISILYTELMNV